jgi:hypothetical protein
LRRDQKRFPRRGGTEMNQDISLRKKTSGGIPVQEYSKKELHVRIIFSS